ncbi:MULTISPECIES: isocitrate lyase/phosphoenolpyruvate mutase family protein [unclassified Caballeronia]|uniref:isocitrate lyase/PEP mutase family protein n=1 Tax=unclassified Caballeronia TaxID=2646786 RepID=UPI0028565AB3|nr:MULTISPECIES: isocitrate lyase/phosphoenolpyruvate mutase family protein [unclassified Caballeronia]MDR5817139.1 isocitrate lyase/phosphoenolpyruvate mutase family protein [Caballeronia sp. LZ033]MDR5824047.1 isocitrate lyase/phosphoenolpyruvate mutase family protein [Caballeronia sp. LZ043]
MKSASHASVLRERLQRKDIVVVPGGGSPLEIRMIARAGFEAAYLSGYATAASRYGVPDIGLVAYGEIENAVLATTRVADVPLIVDCDTGYGDVTNMIRTVQGMERLGVAAIQIEDQAWPKRCGHMDAKIVESREVALRKLRAALEARNDPGTVIIARTDARGPHGLDEALERCRMFRDAGADVVFVDGPQSLEELEIIGRELAGGPLVANMSESGLTPLLSAAELQELGFAIALFPSSTVRLTVRIVEDFLADLKHSGDSRAWVDRMASLAQTNSALGIETMREFEAHILADVKKRLA